MRSLVLVAVLALVVGFLLAGRALVVADPVPARGDAILILAGSVADRTLEAVDLYRTGVARRIVVTRERLQRGEGTLRARGARVAESDRETASVLQQLGVPESAVVMLRRRNRSTTSEARTVARWACRHRLHSLVVVTSRAHTRRARLILRRTLPSVAITVQPSRYDGFSPALWWRDRRDFKAVMGEYEKLANYWLHERWTIKPCGGLRRRAR